MAKLSEKWKEIKGYEGIYEVSTFGNVKKLACAVKSKDGGVRSYKEKILTNSIIKQSNVLVVRLVKNGKSKTKAVHRLVAETFIPNPENLRCVKHKDGNIYNNKIKNLVWSHSVKKEIDPELINLSVDYFKPTIIQYDLEGHKVKEWSSLSVIIEQLGIKQATLNRCLNGHLKTAYGYKWKFK